MSNEEPINATPAEVLQQYLIDLELAGAHDSATWPCFVDSMPDTEEDERNRLVIADTMASTTGVFQHSGRTLQAHSVQIRVRAVSDKVGYGKCAMLRQGLNANRRGIVTLSEREYTIQRVSLASGPARLGKQAGGMYDYTMNYVLGITQEAEEE